MMRRGRWNEVMKKARIRNHLGTPTLFIDGSPHSGFAYMSFNLQEKYVRQFAGPWG